MKKSYWRVSYNGIGIYEALKKQLWTINKFPRDEWNAIKNSKAFTWLKTPPMYSNNSYSYFTELGYTLFMEKTFPIIINYLDKENIMIEKFILDDLNIKIVYRDEHQIVVEQ